jgi:hypothetical protein
MTTADLMVACYGDEGGPDRQFCLGYLLGMWDALPAGDACVKPGITVSAGMLREMERAHNRSCPFQATSRISLGWPSCRNSNSRLSRAEKR